MAAGMQLHLHSTFLFLISSGCWSRDPEHYRPWVRPVDPCSPLRCNATLDNNSHRQQGSAGRWLCQDGVYPAALTVPHDYLSPTETSAMPNLGEITFQRDDYRVLLCPGHLFRTSLGIP
jgi:hypothetical protein